MLDFSWFKQAWNNLFSADGGAIVRGNPTETEIGASPHSGLSDAFTDSPTLLAASYIRTGEMARAVLRVVDEDGEEVDGAQNPVARFFLENDQFALIESTAHDYYIWGRAYWLIDRGGYDLEGGGIRGITSIRRLEPTQVSRLYGGWGQPPDYMYRGERIEDDAIIPFERYDGTSAGDRLRRYLELEVNTLMNRAVDSRYKKPKFVYGGGAAYSAGSERDMAADVRAMETRLASTSNRPVVLATKRDTTLEYFNIPQDDEMAQVRELVIQAVAADSGVPAQFLSSEQAFTRWNVVRDARRTLWESHLSRELERMAAVLTNKLLRGTNLRMRFDVSKIEVLGDSRETQASVNQSVVSTASQLKALLEWSDEEVRDWLETRLQ